MTPLTEQKLRQACRNLFGTSIAPDADFLRSLNPENLRSAYRALARENHPDRFATAAPAVRRRQTLRFQELNHDYQLLCWFLGLRNARPAEEAGAAAREEARSPGGAPEAGPPPLYPHPRVPEVPLEFGRFLYHRGKITYRQMVQALVWQRRQRPQLGVIARNWGWLRVEDVARVLALQTQGHRFGRRAVALGYLSRSQLQILLRFQRSRQKKLGEYFIRRGILSAGEIEDLARELRKHNLRLIMGSNPG
jgi:hypothetical protein